MAAPQQMMMPPQQFMDQNQMPMMMDPDQIGAIKIKDGLFIGDELASTVCSLTSP